jgi:preprotein translocase subunit SecE
VTRGLHRRKPVDSAIGEDMATQVRGPQANKPVKPTGGGPARPERTSPVVFVREVRSELRKVIWPTRKELTTYTTVSVIFILVMVAIVSGVDTGLAHLVFAIF